MSMHRLVVTTALTLALLSGCGVQGRWALRNAAPASGPSDMQIARIALHPNHTFEAIAVMGERTVKARGTYRYCPCRDRLVLVTGEKQLVYKAFRKSCVRLEIERPGPDGQLVTVVFRRQEACVHPSRDECDHAGCH